ncbi:MAG TPA: hypothetical protein VGC45_16010 [Gryllotalpicola sp.]
MPPQPLRSALCFLGHIATHAELLEVHGQESAILPFRINAGASRRLRTGLYVCAHLSESELTAAWCGGHLDCLTVLAELGLPVDDGGELHLRLARGHGRASARRRVDAPLTHAHWSRLRTPIPRLEETLHAARLGEPLDRLRVPVVEALRQAMTTCLSYAASAEVLRAMVSAGHPADELARTVASTPRRVQLALRRIGTTPPEVRHALERLTPGNLF